MKFRNSRIYDTKNLKIMLFGVNSVYIFDLQKPAGPRAFYFQASGGPGPKKIALGGQAYGPGLKPAQH